MTRRINPSSALIFAGLILTVLAVMFRPAGAEATLPTEAIVFSKPDDTSGATVKYADLQSKQITADYSVIPSGKKSAVTTSLTGIPLIDFLKAANVNTDGVQFVRVRIGVNDDSFITLQPLNPESTAGRPPMVLASGALKGQGALTTPQLIPGQPTDTPIKQDQFLPFNRKSQELTFIPGQPGAKIMSVRVKKTRTSKGQYQLKASVTAGTSGSTTSMKYQWYAGEKDGTVTVVSNKSTYTTTDATTGTSTHVVNVVVTETGTGSMGARSAEYASKKPDDGTTSKPKTTTPGTTTPGTVTPTTPGTTGIPGGGSPGGVPTTTPPITVPNQPSTTTPPTTTSPTPPTSTPQPQQNTSADTSGITNVAQNVNGTGKLTTVSGVLLSAPTVAAASTAGSGTPLSTLPAPVADELNSLFKPVDSPDDLWPYLLAVLFALSISGAVREWVKP